MRQDTERVFGSIDELRETLFRPKVDRPVDGPWFEPGAIESMFQDTQSTIDEKGAAVQGEPSRDSKREHA